MQNSNQTVARQRLTSLDALRGIASCVVVISHCYLSIPNDQKKPFEGSLWSFFLKPFHNGDAAVIIFFLLSGYVLALPYLRGSQLTYRRYVIRRICRIYLPFAIAICLALLLYSITPLGHVVGMSEWFNEQWLPQLADARVIVSHFLMIGTGQDIGLNTPIWTLIHEMRISLIFPMLVLLCRDSRVGFLAVVGLLVVPVKIVSALGGESHPAYASNITITLLWTAAMVPYFLTGILLCKHREWISVAWARLPLLLRGCLFAPPAGAFCVTLSFNSVKLDAFYALAGAVLIVLAVESKWLRACLDTTVPQWLGRVSYSLYLVHMPILLALGSVMMARVPFWLIAAAVMALSLAAAAVMHKMVEAPAIRLGRWMTSSDLPASGVKPVVKFS